MESKEEPERREFCLTEWERGGTKGGGLPLLPAGLKDWATGGGGGGGDSVSSSVTLYTLLDVVSNSNKRAPQGLN